MELIGDVWVNWFEGEENGYNVCEFHEWRKHDFIELLDQVPLIKVETSLYLYIENDLADLPQQLLKDVRNKCYIRKNNQRQTKEYCFIATDGFAHIVVDTLGYYIPIRKSRLIPRQEQLILDKSNLLPVSTYSFQKTTSQKEYHVLSPSPDVMRGLTRRERQLKQILFMALDQMYSSGNLAELRYWYTEWCPKEYIESQNYSFKEIWDKLYAIIQYGWSQKHATLCERMIKGQPYFEKIWELEDSSLMNEARGL